MNINRIVLTGHIQTMPEFEETMRGDTFARFCLVSQDQWRNYKGEVQQRRQWHRVLVFSQDLTHIVKQCITQGTQVYLEGKLNYRKIFTDDGRDVIMAEVIVQRPSGMIHILNNKPVASHLSRLSDDQDLDSQDEDYNK